MKVFFGINESGVAYWRGKLPALKMKKLGLCDVSMFSVYDTDPEKSDQMVKDADIVYCPSPCGIDSIVGYLKYYQDGKKTIADYDDDLFNCHPFNPGYSTLGLKEVKIKVPDMEEQYLWQDGRMGFSIKDNVMRYKSHVDVLHVSTLITTTTDYLKDTLSKEIARPKDEFVIVPNAIDFDMFKPMPFRKRTGSKIRIGWTASDSHMLEGQMMNQIVRKLYTKRQDFEFVILGNIEKFKSSVKDIPIEWHPFCDISIYPAKIASLELDIGICPLDDFPFNHCKSALKWSEYSAFNIPSVCSDITPYKLIEHGKDGMLASSVDDFVEKIETLMDDSILRKSIGQNAFERNYQDFNLDKVAYKWLDVFDRAMSIDKSLTYNGKLIPVINDRLQEVPV